MQIFYTPDITGEEYVLDPEESKHCVRVLRMEEGEEVCLVDGRGGLYMCRITDANPKGCRVAVGECKQGYGARPFRLHIAIAPTKNIDRIEWMLEKCTEIGTDEFTMLSSEHSERRNVRDDRLEKVIVSAMKQSVKAFLPQYNSVVDFCQFVNECTATHKFIAHCHEGEKKRLDEVYVAGNDVAILIGPEGDFSEEEVAFAEAAGFVSITLGTSRLRTETAGIVACHSINFMNRI